MVSLKNNRHVPVLLQEVIEGLSVKSGEQYIDATTGDAGHTKEILKKGGILLAIDSDPKAINRAKGFISEAQKVTFAVGNYKNLEKIAVKHGFTKSQGILFDLGVSSAQLEDPTKGLSFTIDAPLDMRLDPKLKVTAKNLLNQLTKEQLYEILTRNAQEELAWPIAEAIVSSRSLKPIETTGELANIVVKAQAGKKLGLIHPATKTFLALKIQVNKEIDNLNKGLSQAIKILKKDGRLVVISFHETEDRLVKLTFKKAQNQQALKILTKKPITASEAEININPRSRSAKLRIAQKK